MIAFIYSAIAAVLAALVIALFVRLRAASQILRLGAHRGRGAGLNDLLKYAAVVDNGVVVCKDGSLLAAWSYAADDNASSTEAQREFVASAINQALVRLGSGWMIHVDAVRRPAPRYPAADESHFPDPVSAAIEDERRALFESLGNMYEGQFVLTATYMPPAKVQQRLAEMMFDDEGKVTDSDTARLLGTFGRECRALESRLSTAVKLKRLAATTVQDEDGRLVHYDDLLSWLQFCISGDQHPVRLPSQPIYLDAVLGGRELWGGTLPRIGRRYLQVVAIEGLPVESQPGILTALSELQADYRWSSRFIFMDTHEAIANMEKFRKRWKQKVRGFMDQVFNIGSGQVDQDALSMVEDADAAIAELNSGFVAHGYYTSVVVLMDENREVVESAARYIEKTVNSLGFVARIETINTMDAWLGSLPGHGVENVRRPLINTLNLADMIPTSSIWTGTASAPCPMYPPGAPPLMSCVTQGATPFRLNLHVRDLGHSFIFGPTGAGKSTHLALIAAQLRRYRDMTIYCFDKGNSMFPLVTACGGLHFEVGSDDSRLAFCPLQFLDSRADRAWAMSWVDTLLALNGLHTTAAQRNEIGMAIMSMHRSGACTLSEFVLTLQDTAMREALHVYTADGAMGHLLDAAEDGLAMSDFTVFEIEELLSLGDKFALPVLLYLFRRIEVSLRGQPAAIILDEAWIMLGHDVFREKIREWLKVLRKSNCLVLMATQSLSDAANSGILDVIVESTATKIFLPNVHAQDEDAAALYRRMGLNARQIEIIARATPKRHYYYVSEQGRRLYDLALGPLALAFVGHTDRDSVARIKVLMSREGENWPAIWARQKGAVLAHSGVEQ